VDAIGSLIPECRWLFSSLMGIVQVLNKDFTKITVKLTALLPTVQRQSAQPAISGHTVGTGPFESI